MDMVLISGTDQDVLDIQSLTDKDTSVNEKVITPDDRCFGYSYTQLS